jgi:hypothetical protein
MIQRADYLAYFLEKSKEKNFDLSAIRKEMTAANRPEEEIKSVVRAVDEVLVQRAVASNGPEWLQKLRTRGLRLSGSGLIMVGGTIIAFGVLLTIVSFVKNIMGITEHYYVHFGPMVWGFFIVLAGIARKSQETRENNKMMSRRFERNTENDPDHNGPLEQLDRFT